MKIISIFLPYMGCEEKCSFCNQQILNDVFVVPAETQIRKRIENALETISEEEEIELAFFGCSFSSMSIEKQEEYLKIAKDYMDRIKGIRISAHPNSFGKDEVKLLKKYNVTTIEIGIESMSNGVLKESGRKYAHENVINDIKILKKAGFKVVGQLMLGLPTDTKRKFLNSIKELVKTEIDYIRFHPTLVLKNTDLEVKYIENEYKPLTLEEALDWMIEAMKFMEEKKVPVIRIGLFPSKSLLRQGNVVAGPMHPSLGELLKGRIFREKIEEKIDKKTPRNSFLEIIVNPKNVSKANGYKKENIIHFIKKFGFNQVKVTPDENITENVVEVNISK